jgi:serine/threonine-protein kinase
MRYQRLMSLGSGGMANVHLSLAVGQSGFKRLVVVKSVRDELVADPSMRLMFLAEARISARLNHPNVVQVSEVLETPEGVMLVMEYLDGAPLSAAYRTLNRQLTLPMRLRILCEVLAGLHYAHDLLDYHGGPLGVVHRDVSPQNVFLTYDGRVKLLDFGVAKVTASPDKTRTGVIKGRVAYMPLEQVSGKAVDRRSDVYAVGCLLFEAVANSRMWGRLTEPQIVRELLRGSIPRLSERVEVDAELERIVSKATAQLPVDRYPSAEALRLELERYLNDIGPVSLREIGELLSRESAGARGERQREIAAAVALAEREMSTLIELESAKMRVAPESGVTPRSRSLRSFSPTPGPFLAPTVPPPLPSERMPSSSAAVELRPPRRRLWIAGALALAGALAAAAWLPRWLPMPDGPVSAAVPIPLSALPIAPSAPIAAPEAAAEVPEAAASASAAPSAKPRARPHLAPPSRAPAFAAPARPARASASCDPPYFFAAGIKTYKPECL